MTLRDKADYVRRILATAVALTLSPPAHAYGQEAIVGMLGILAVTVWIFAVIASKAIRNAKIESARRLRYLLLGTATWLAAGLMFWFGLVKNPDDSLPLALIMLISVAALSMGFAFMVYLAYAEIRSRLDATSTSPPPS